MKAYLAACKAEAAFVEKTISGIRLAGFDFREIREVARFLGFANILSDRIRRRVLEGEKIPHEEKIFSIYETTARWISKGKAGCPVELGVPICIIADQCGHILHMIVMREGTDKDQSVKLVEKAQERFPGLRVASFGRGFHSPENQVELDNMLDFNAMPKKGKPAEAERARRNDPLLKKMANWHSGIESCINNLEQRGMDRVLSYGADGFERMANLSVLALNVHRLGLTELRRDDRPCADDGENRVGSRPEAREGVGHRIQGMNLAKIGGSSCPNSGLRDSFRTGTIYQIPP